MARNRRSVAGEVVPTLHVWQQTVVARATRLGLRLVLVAVLVVTGSCQSSSESTTHEPLALKAVELGRGTDASGRVTEATREFDSTSTVFATIETEGAGRAKLNVEWKSGGKTLNTEARDINPTRPAQFAFHFAPPDGWPRGRAILVFSLDDAEKHTAAFEVR